MLGTSTWLPTDFLRKEALSDSPLTTRRYHFDSWKVFSLSQSLLLHIRAYWSFRAFLSGKRKINNTSTLPGWKRPAALRVIEIFLRWFFFRFSSICNLISRCFFFFSKKILKNWGAENWSQGLVMIITWFFDSYVWFILYS